MATVQKNLAVWHKLIVNGEIETAFKQLKSVIAAAEWTTEEENKMVNYCLISANMRAFDLFRRKDKDPCTSQQIFLLADFCCCTIEKTWECKSVADFLGSIRVIGQYLLDLNHTYAALVIGQYGMRFSDHYYGRKLSKDEIAPTMKDMLSIYCHHMFKIPIDNLEKIIDVWKFVLSPQGIETKRSHFTIIFKYFGNFCCKVNSTEHLQASLLVMSYLSKMPFINLADQETETFVNICDVLIRYSKPDQMRNTITDIVCCIDQMKSSLTATQRLVLQFCCDVLRFSICKVDSSASNLINDCVKGGNTISSAIPSLRHRAVNFSRVVLIQTQTLWINAEKCFYRSCLLNLFIFFTKLSEAVRTADLDQIESISEIKYFNVSNLALFTISRIRDWNSAELMGIYSYVKKCFSMSLEVYNDDSKISNSQRTQLYENIGAYCCKACFSYMEVDLYDNCEELCSITMRKIISVSDDLIHKSSLQNYIANLAICLYKSKKGEKSLETTCIWAAKLPNSREMFMNHYGIFKSNFLYGNPDGNQELVNKTCLDFIKDYKMKNPSIWKNFNFTDYDAMVLLKLELKQIFKRQLYSASLVQKIITQSEKYDVTSKIEVYILGAFIFSYSDKKFLNNALSLLPAIDNFIAELNLKSAQKVSKEKIIRCNSFLGFLHYVKFRIQLLNARSKSEEEINIVKSIKTAPTGPEMEVENRDDSDVIHKYLTYKSQQEFISYLDSAIDSWSRGITLASDGKDIEELEICSKISEQLDVQVLIQDIALMYRLYCAESKEIRAWKLLHSIASIRQDDEKIVYAFSNLVSLNAQVDPEWETKVQQKLTGVEKPTQIRYRLETIHKLFINGRGIEGVEMLSQLSEDDVKDHVSLAAKYYFLISQYTLANFFNVPDYPLKTALQAYQLLMNCLKTNACKYYWEKSEVLYLILDVSLFIIQFHLTTSQTNLIRSFVDQSVYFAKKFVFPIRFCKILTILCGVGVITCKCDDIYVKLDALKSVLKLNDSIKEENYDKKFPIKTPATLSSVDFYSNKDIRFVSNFDDNYTSPILPSGLKYDKPEFISHKSCDCSVCDDMHYQQISCEVMSLFGCYFWMQKSSHHGQALRHFEDALEMASELCSRWKAVDRSKVDGFLKIQIVTKMRLGDFWASSDDFDKAEKLNREALNEYENLIMRDGALRAQLTDQYLALEYIKLNAKIEQDLPKKRTVRQKLAMKTPACKTAVTVFEDTETDSRVAEMMKSMAITPLPRHSRRLLFKDDDEFSKPAASSRTARIKNKKEDTPPDIVMRTPSSLKINHRQKLNDRLKVLHTYSRSLKNEDNSVKMIDADVPQTPSSRTRSNKILESAPSNENKILDHVSTLCATTSKKILESKTSSDVVQIDDKISAAADAFVKKILRSKTPCDAIKFDNNFSTPTVRSKKERKLPSDEIKIKDDLLVTPAASSKKKTILADVIEIDNDLSAAADAFAEKILRSKTPYDDIKFDDNFSTPAVRSKKERKLPSDEIKIKDDLLATAAASSKKKKRSPDVIEIDNDLSATGACSKKETDLPVPVSNSKKKIRSNVIKIDDDLLSAAARCKKKNKIPLDVIKTDDILPTTTSEKENNKPSVVIENDDNPSSVVVEPAPIRKRGRDRVPPLNIVKEVPTSSRSRLKKSNVETASSLTGPRSRLEIRKN